MSLELALQQATAAFQQNTAAIEKLIAALTTPGENQVPEEIAAATEPDPPKTKRASKKEAAPATLGEQVVPEQSAQSPAPGATDAPETAGAAPQTKGPATYDDAAAAVTKVQKTLGTPKAKELLASFGGKTLKDVAPERFDDVIRQAERLLVDAGVPF